MPDDLPLARRSHQPRRREPHREVQAAAVTRCRPARARRDVAHQSHGTTASTAWSGMLPRSRHEEALRRASNASSCSTRRQAALTDELTGLPNRRLSLERLEKGAPPLGRAPAVFFVDLDDFKAINDALGHTAGDAMLRSTTNRLLNICPTPDQWGRIGGDEFVLFLEHCDHSRASSHCATALRLAAPADRARRAAVLHVGVGRRGRDRAGHDRVGRRGRAPRRHRDVRGQARAPRARHAVPAGDGAASRRPHRAARASCGAR